VHCNSSVSTVLIMQWTADTSGMNSGQIRGASFALQLGPTFKFRGLAASPVVDVQGRLNPSQSTNEIKPRFRSVLSSTSPFLLPRRLNAAFSPEFPLLLVRELRLQTALLLGSSRLMDLFQHRTLETFGRSSAECPRRGTLNWALNKAQLNYPVQKRMLSVAELLAH
jgi:hypothetical protein